MKTKLLWVCLSVITVGFIAVGTEYIARLNNRTTLLEARLARVEADLNSTRVARAQALVTPLISTQSAGAPTFQIGLGSPGEAPKESLERRVDKIEQELKPHLELLAFPKSDMQGGRVAESLPNTGVQEPLQK